MGNFGHRAVQGFAFGLGFSLAVAIAWFVLQQVSGLAGEVAAIVSTAAPEASRASAERAAAVAAIANAPGNSVQVAAQRTERRNGDVVVLGTLRNDSGALVRAVRVEAAFYDAGGGLVDLCGWYVAPALAPGEEKPFKVSCGGTPERPSPESDSVRIRLVETL